MANIELKFIDEVDENINSRIVLVDNSIKIIIDYSDQKSIQSIYLDKSTAIKFAKTLRTEINKIQD